MKGEKDRLGILICGLNGVGKSTLGRKLAELIGFDFFDIESYYFPNSDPNNPYGNSRSKAEVCELLLADLEKSDSFVLASVSGDYPEAIRTRFTHIVMVETPREIRLERVRSRSYKRFGERMLPGGELYESEEAFFRMAEARGEDYVQKRTRLEGLPVLYVDGTLEVTENAKRIAQAIEAERI